MAGNNNYKAALIEFCRQKLRSKDPELFASAASVLLSHGALNWTRTKSVLAIQDWWARSTLIKDVRQDMIGDPSYEALINSVLRDQVADVALVAAGALIAADLSVRSPTRDVRNKLAQIALKQAGLIGRISATSCPVSSIIADVLGDKASDINWRQIIPRNQYKDFLRKVVRWRSYAATDPTAWVNLSDTMNDIVLDSLYAHDPSIGTYNLGNLGSVLWRRPNRLSTAYPKMFAAAKEIHEKRKHSDLSHAVHRNSGKPTSFIRHKETENLRKLLVAGYIEMWKAW